MTSAAAVSVSSRSHADWTAMVYGLGSALGYSAANVCLRRAAHLDPVWVSQLKSIPLMVVIGPILMWRMTQGKAVGIPWRTVLLICLAGAVGQLGGNILFQWSLGVVGIALAVPVTTGAQIVSGAAMGYFFLGDRIARRLVGAAALLILAISILGFGAEQANRAVREQAAARVVAAAANAGTSEHPGAADSANWQLVAWGIGSACISGCAYSVLGVTLRRTTQQGAPIATLLFLVGIVGFTLLGTLVSIRHGRAFWGQTCAEDYATLLAAGLFNVVAFASLTKALRVSSVVFVNALSASQIALAAVAGVLLFNEPWTYTLSVGVALTMLGLFLMRPREPAPVEKRDVAHERS